MKKRIAVILCLVMLFTMTLTGCGGLGQLGGNKLSEKDQILGTWKTTVDLSDMINEELAGEDASLAKYFDLDFSITLIMTFNEDDTCELKADREALEKTMDDLIEQMEDGMIKYLEDILKSAGLDMTVEEYLQMANISLTDIIEESFDEAMADDILEGLEQDAQYAVKDGKLYLSDDADTAISELVYNPYKLEGDTLTIEAGNSDKGEDYEDFLFPMVLTRVK